MSTKTIARGEVCGLNEVEVDVLTPPLALNAYISTDPVCVLSEPSGVPSKGRKKLTAPSPS